MDIIQLLLESVRKEKKEIPESNLFREIGFDGDSARLGWVLPPSWEEVEKNLKKLLPYLEGKKKFIFVGIGGSINGPKTLHPLDKNRCLYFLDNLDPLALKNILNDINDLGNTLAIAISKSGSTLETQLLAKTMRSIYSDKWQKHIIWFTDKNSFSKLDSLGWEEANKFSIQVDGRTDIGGRFSCPHTLIFLLPLFLVLEQDFSKLKEYFFYYLSLQEKLREKAKSLALSYKDIKEAFFHVIVDGFFKDHLETWVTQLIQESLGSKKDNFFVKTALDAKTSLFLPLNLDETFSAPFVHLMSFMYFLQIFVACFSYFKSINFVNQPYVEKYKKVMRTLSDEDLTLPEPISLTQLFPLIQSKITDDIKFVEVIFYGYIDKEKRVRIKKLLDENFPFLETFVFLGSDWNHHSYQAAFCDPYTLYVILLKNDYSTDISSVSKEILKENVLSLQKISFATFKTLENHSLYFALDI